MRFPDESCPTISFKRPAQISPKEYKPVLKKRKSSRNLASVTESRVLESKESTVSFAGVFHLPKFKE